MRLKSRLLITAALAIALFPAAVTAASAKPFAGVIADKRAQAAAVQKQVDGLVNQAEIATERYNAARGRYERVAAKERAVQARIDRLQRHTDKLENQLNGRADALYRQGPLGSLNLLLSTRSIQQFVTAMHALTEMSHNDAETIAELKTTKKQAVAAHVELVAARKAADRQQTRMASAAAEVKAKEAARVKVLASLKGDIRALLLKQKLAEDAASRRALARLIARQRAAARASGEVDTGGGSWDGGGNPPASGRGAKAVWWAMKALGKPYRWGADGPNSFDCSGLVMWAYRHVGVHLPHHSGSQISHGKRVSRGNLQPGDLVFFGSPIHHVGMYVGGGDFIEAPYTGANVRIRPLSGRGDFAGACRP